jgi:hypothetical protein
MGGGVLIGSIFGVDGGGVIGQGNANTGLRAVQMGYIMMLSPQLRVQ